MDAAAWTPIVVSLIGVAGTVVTAWGVALINARVKDAQLREVLNSAVKNAVGAVQQGTTSMIAGTVDPMLKGVVPEHLIPGVQYVQDQASEAVARFSQTPEVIASKISAQIGLQEIATNLAVSGSSVPIVVPPLAPVEATIERVNP